MYNQLDCQRLYTEQEALANEPSARNSTEYPDIIPSYRRPSKSQLTSLVNQCKKRQELARKSFEALRLLARSHPNLVIELVSLFSCSGILILLEHWYQGYDEERQEPLIFICTAPSAMNAAIMWQANGIALDSSWRHKNEHVAPLTFLVTLDNQMKMIPSEHQSGIYYLLHSTKYLNL